MTSTTSTTSSNSAAAQAGSAISTAKKSSSEIPITNIYYLLCYAWDVLKEKSTVVEVDAVNSTDLISLFAQVLVTGTRLLLKKGLERGYRPCEDEIAGVRGKLLVTQTLLHDLIRQGRSACSWDELEYDTPPNRILKATFQSLYHASELKNDVRKDIKDILRWLDPVQTIKLRAEHFHRIQFHRNNRIYTVLIHVCEFIYEHWLPDEQGRGRYFRDFERDHLPALFEKFVYNFYHAELSKGEGWQVGNPTINWQCSGTNTRAEPLLPCMKTDVCIKGVDKAIILDTKFYAKALKPGVYDSPEKLHTANLYQIFTYLRQKSCDPGWEHAEGVLLYPRTTYDLSADFTTQGHRIRAITLDLTQPWPKIHKSLMSLVGLGVNSELEH